MSENRQIQTIIATAKTAPNRIGVFIDDYKEERFLRKLRDALSAAEFEIQVTNGPTPRTKTIIIKRKVIIDASNN